eukprot:sb/3467937/
MDSSEGVVMWRWYNLLIPELITRNEESNFIGNTVGPRFSGRINFPRYTYRILTIFHPDLPGKTLSPEHPGKSGFDCISNQSPTYNVLLIDTTYTVTPLLRRESEVENISAASLKNIYNIRRSPNTNYPSPFVESPLTQQVPLDTEYESNWRPKCKDEEKKTPQLYERNRQLRLELQMLYKQADTVISHAQAMKATDDRKGMAFPSIKNNLRINLQKLQQEVTEQRKRVATANIKYEAEKSNREAVEKEVKQLRQELINSKIKPASVPLSINLSSLSNT